MGFVSSLFVIFRIFYKFFVTIFHSWGGGGGGGREGAWVYFSFFVAFYTFIFLNIFLILFYFLHMYT
jgi:hypothetical protein